MLHKIYTLLHSYSSYWVDGMYEFHRGGVGIKHTFAFWVIVSHPFRILDGEANLHNGQRQGQPPPHTIQVAATFFWYGG